MTVRIATQPDGDGLWLVTAGVTPGKTGVPALLRLVRSWLLAPARLEELA